LVDASAESSIVGTHTTTPTCSAYTTAPESPLQRGSHASVMEPPHRNRSGCCTSPCTAHLPTFSSYPVVCGTAHPPASTRRHASTSTMPSGSRQANTRVLATCRCVRTGSPGCEPMVKLGSASVPTREASLCTSWSSGWRMTGLYSAANIGPFVHIIPCSFNQASTRSNLV